MSRWGVEYPAFRLIIGAVSGTVKAPNPMLLKAASDANKNARHLSESQNADSQSP